MKYYQANEDVTVKIFGHIDAQPNNFTRANLVDLDENEEQLILIEGPNADYWAGDYEDLQTQLDNILAPMCIDIAWDGPAMGIMPGSSFEQMPEVTRDHNRIIVHRRFSHNV